MAYRYDKSTRQSIQLREAGLKAEVRRQRRVEGKRNWYKKLSIEQKQSLASRRRAYVTTFEGRLAVRAASMNVQSKQRGDGSKVSRNELLGLWHSQSGCCKHCNISLLTFEFDHIIPYGLGGLHCVDNLQVLCVACHQVKSNQEKRLKPLDTAIVSVKPIYISGGCCLFMFLVFPSGSDN